MSWSLVVSLAWRSSWFAADAAGNPRRLGVPAGRYRRGAINPLNAAAGL